MTQATNPLTLLPMSKQLLTVRQAADILTVSDETVRHWFKAGRLEGVRVGKGIRIKTEAVNRLLVEGGAK